MSVKKIVEEAGVPTFMTVGGDPVIMAAPWVPTLRLQVTPAFVHGGAEALRYLKAKV